jgi:hypothetical protein
VLQVVRPHGDGSSLEGDSSKGQWIKARQRSAFPPNFIHSIDSTHMMMTALECSKEGEWVFFGGGGGLPASQQALRYVLGTRSLPCTGPTSGCCYAARTDCSSMWRLAQEAQLVVISKAHGKAT